MSEKNKNLSDAVKEASGKQAVVEAFSKFNELMAKRRKKTPFEVACEEFSHLSDTSIFRDECPTCKNKGDKCRDCYKAYFVAVAGAPDG